jgi:hypothetical protein
MTRKNLLATLIAVTCLDAIAGTIVIAQEPKDAKSAGQPELKLPPGWTAEDMQAVMLAGAPGKMHEHLAKDVGVWHGKNTMWMAPGAEPMKSESTSTITPMMDGRFTKLEVAGEMPGMGPFHAIGITGFDNVSQKFVSTWIDNHGTGMMNGTGELSRDGKTLTWRFSYNCPVTKKPAVMRQVETTTGPKTKTLEMFAAEPKSGKVYKMMSIELTKTNDAPSAAGR